jgi:UDP:flavonoid glycosyltransferase YjiC (YdhE family)
VTSYLFALVDAGGTVPPELGAVRRLVERGHRVDVIGEDSMREEVLAAGARFTAWSTFNRPDRSPENDPMKDWEASGPRHLISRMEPLVLVAMSSTFQDQIEVLQRCIDALASLPVRGLVTTGQAVDPSVLRAAPRVTVVAAAPHSEVLKHASVVLTHGGHGTATRIGRLRTVSARPSGPTRPRADWLPNSKLLRQFARKHPDRRRLRSNGVVAHSRQSR